jgi:non-ribosomal peptide synthase protein (TIGR01720 family)
LPTDVAEATADTSVGAAAAVTVGLDVAETRSLESALLRRPTRVHLHEAVLSGLAASLCRWARTSFVTIDVSAHGREESLLDVDLSRTIGYFTSIFPFRAEVDPNASTSAVLDSVVDRLRRVPNGGIGYGLLRYSNRGSRLPAAPSRQVSFHYLGARDMSASRGLIRVTRVASWPAQRPDERRTYLLEVVALVAEGCLRIDFNYSPAVHRAATIAKIAEQAMTFLRAASETPR